MATNEHIKCIVDMYTVQIVAFLVQSFFETLQYCDEW